jgi:hypothetical protein
VPLNIQAAFCALFSGFDNMANPAEIEDKQIEALIEKYHANFWSLTQLVRLAYEEGYTSAYNEIVGDVTNEPFED